MTYGFEVLVHEVIEAITTAPWSRSNSVPFSMVTGVGLLTRPCAPVAADTVADTGACGLPPSPLPAAAGLAGSQAGKLTSPASSTEEPELAAVSGSVASGVPA